MMNAVSSRSPARMPEARDASRCARSAYRLLSCRSGASPWKQKVGCFIAGPWGGGESAAGNVSARPGELPIARVSESARITQSILRSTVIESSDSGRSNGL